MQNLKDGKIHLAKMVKIDERGACKDWPHSKFIRKELKVDGRAQRGDVNTGQLNELLKNMEDTKRIWLIKFSMIKR